MMNAMKCPNCGANLMDNPEYKFCPYCAVEIPKPEPQKTINIFQTNQNSTYIRKEEKKTSLDKFLEHRQAIKTIKMESRIEREEEARLAAEAEQRRKAEEREREQAAEAERKRRKEEKEQKEREHSAHLRRVVGRTIVGLMIPVCFFVLDTPLTAIAASAFLLFVCFLIK